MNTNGNLSSPQALDGQRIIDFSGLRVINRVGLCRRFRQCVFDNRGFQTRKANTFRKVVKQKALPMKFVGRGNGPRFL